MFSFSLRRFRTGFDAHIANSPVGTRRPFPSVKWPDNKLEHLPPSTVGVINVWRYTSHSSWYEVIDGLEQVQILVSISNFRPRNDYTHFSVKNKSKGFCGS
jgi:hypothetical protein